MKEYKCTSRIVTGRSCEHNCQVKCEFEPRGCLKYAVAEEWQEISNEKIAKPDVMEQSEQFICRDCDKPGKEYKDGFCEICYKM